MAFGPQSNVCAWVFVCGCHCMGGFSYKTRLSSHTRCAGIFENVTKPDS